MSTLAEREAEIIELFEWIEDDTDRYTQIIELGRKLSPFPEEFRTEISEVKGCQSKVWMHHQYEGETILFFADSNTAITKGIVSLLVFLWSGLTKKELDQANLEILEKIELRKYLSSQRSNGLTAMIMRMKAVTNR